MGTRTNASWVRSVAAAAVLGAMTAEGFAGSAAQPAGAPVVTIQDAAAKLGLTADVTALAAGRATARPLDTENDAELCASGAIIIDVPADVLANGFRDLSLLRSSGLLVAAGRFSDEPQLADLDALAIPEGEINELSTAQAGNSGIKLSALEIAALRGAQPGVVAATFKQALLQRVVAWRERGNAGLGIYDDKRKPVEQSQVATMLLTSLASTRPSYSFVRDESFEYWSVERFGNLKPLVALTNMSIHRRPGVVRIETVQLYASHYCEGLVTSIDLLSLGGTVGNATLVRLTLRAQVDSFTGMMGSLKRRVGRARVVEQLAQGLELLRSSSIRTGEKTLIATSGK
jgi:hypothetical protein